MVNIFAYRSTRFHKINYHYDHISSWCWYIIATVLQGPVAVYTEYIESKLFKWRTEFATRQRTPPPRRVVTSLPVLSTWPCCWRNPFPVTRTSWQMGQRGAGPTVSPPRLSSPKSLVIVSGVTLNLTRLLTYLLSAPVARYQLKIAGHRCAAAVEPDRELIGSWMGLVGEVVTCRRRQRRPLRFWVLTKRWMCVNCPDGNCSDLLTSAHPSSSAPHNHVFIFSPQTYVCMCVSLFQAVRPIKQTDEQQTDGQTDKSKLHLYRLQTTS